MKKSGKLQGKLHGRLLKCQLSFFLEHDLKIWDNLKGQFMNYLEVEQDLKAACLRWEAMRKG